MRQLLWAAALCTLATGCGAPFRTTKSPKQTDRNEYAREAFRQQHRERQFMDDEARWDQTTERDLLVTIEESPEKKWARLPYETIDEWLDRIYLELRQRNEQLLDQEGVLQSLQTSEREYINEIQQLLEVHQELREILMTRSTSFEPTQIDNPAVAATISTGEKPPEFFVHFVRPGDTLFSIAQHYYGDKEMISEILRWNQRWVRNEYELVAGLGLILFPGDASEKNPQVVETYIERLEVPRS